MFAAIAAAMALPERVAQQDALGKVAPYRSRGKGRGSPSRNYGNKAGRYSPHQGGQERARRLVGGWAWHQYMTGVTKAQAIAAANAQHRVVIEAAA